MKKILALILALAMLLSFAACNDDSTDDVTTTTAAEDVTDEAVDAGSEEVSDEATDAVETSAEDVSAEDVSSEDVSSENTSSENTSSEDVSNEETTAEGETTTAAIAAKPETKAEIVALYNNAVNSAYSAKAGFSKERMTDNEKLDASAVLSAFKSLVYQFMGVGEENKYTETVKKGNWESDANKHYLRKSTLTASDVTKATCTEKNGQYTVVLNVKGGSSKGSESSCYTNAPIDKCGICVGNEDKGYYDHKTGEVIYDAIAGTYAGATIEEKYSNAKVTAVIDGATGNLVKLTVEFDIDVAIDIGIGSGTATATTHIYYKNFKY